MIIARQYISYAANLAAVILMIWQLIRIEKLPADRSDLKQYFRRFSGMVLFMSVIWLFGSYASIRLGGITRADFGRLHEMEQASWYWIAVAAVIIEIFVSTVFIYMWITFLSWALYNDRDFIRRKFWLGFIPLIASAVITAIFVPAAVMSKRGFRNFIIAVVLFFAIRMFYFVLSLKVLQDYKKQNGYLRFFNPWMFFIPVFLGWVLQDVFDWGFSALGSTMGVVLIYTSIIAELRYMDPEMGLYNMDFVGYLKKLIGKNLYDPGSAMIFKLGSAKEMAGFSEILKKQLPVDCEPIIHTDSEIVVLTNVTKREPLMMVIADVMELSGIRGSISLKKKDETTLDFMERVL